MRRTAKDTEGNARKVTRRALFLGGAQVAFIAVLGARMRYMQVEEAEEYRLLAEENRINIRLIPPARGLILDRNGRLIAANSYAVRLHRRGTNPVRHQNQRVRRAIHGRPVFCGNRSRGAPR